MTKKKTGGTDPVPLPGPPQVQRQLRRLAAQAALTSTGVLPGRTVITNKPAPKRTTTRKKVSK